MSHKKFGPDRFSPFDVYLIETNEQTDRQTSKVYIYKWFGLLLFILANLYSMQVNHYCMYLSSVTVLFTPGYFSEKYSINFSISLFHNNNITQKVQLILVNFLV